MSTTIDGKPWTQPAFPYQAKCLHWIRTEFAGLNKADAVEVRKLLEGTGCEPLLKASN